MNNEMLLEAYLNSPLFSMKHTPSVLGRILKSNLNLSKQAIMAIDTDILNYLSQFFDFEKAETVTINDVTRNLYGSKTGLFHLFMSLYISSYRLINYQVPPVEFYKYNIGVDIAWLFWPNVADYIYSISAQIKQLYHEGKLVSSLRMVHPFIIQEVDSYVEINKLILEPINTVFNKIAKYDAALAISFTIQVLSYHILSQKGIKVPSLYDNF